MKKTRSAAAVKILSLSVMALAFFFVQFHRNTPGVMRDELLEAFGMSATQFGLFSSMYFYPYMLAQLPVGMLLDSVGVRRTVGLCSAAAAVGAVLFGVSGSYPLACVGRVLIGVGVSAPVISTQKFLVSWMGEGKSASCYSVFSFVGKLGGMAAQLPLAWLIQQLSWRAIFFGCAAVSITIAVLCVSVVRDAPGEPLHRTRNGTADSKGSLKELLCAMGRIFLNRYIWLAMVVMFLQQGLYGLFSSTWAIPYLQDVFGLSSLQASTYTSCMLIGAMAFSLLAGMSSDALHSRKKVIAVVSGVLLLVWTLLAFCGGLLMRTGLMWPVMFLMGAGGSGVQILFAYSREMNDPRYIGLSVSVINMVGMLGSAAFPTVFGSILDAFAVSHSGQSLYQIAFMPCIVLSAIALLCSMALRDTGCRNCYESLHTAENK